MKDYIYIEIKEKINSYFEGLGFKTKIGNINEIDNFITEYTFENEVKKDLLWISIQSDPMRERFVMNFLTRRRINIIESFFSEEYLNKMEDTRADIYTINLFSDFLEGKRLHLTNEIINDLDGFFHRIIRYIEINVLPSFHKYKTIKDLDLEVNQELKYANPLWATNYWLYKLVIAKLANNQEFYNKLYEHIIEMYTRGIKKYPDRPRYKNCLYIADQLHEDLENVQPDENYVIA